MWHINCLEMLAIFQALKHFLLDLRGHRVLVRTDNTSVVSYILRSRYPVETGWGPRGMEAPHRGDGADLEEVWSSPGGHVCISRDLTMSLLFLSNSSSSIGAGCHGTDMAEDSASHAILPAFLWATCFNFSEADIACSECAFKLSGLYVTRPWRFAIPLD